jgi:hypothetical protein
MKTGEKEKRRKEKGKKGKYKLYYFLPFSVLLCSVLLFFACEEETVDYGLGEYYQEIVTSLGSHNYLSDAGEKLYNARPGSAKSYEDSTRVLLTYSFTEDIEPSPNRGKAVTVHSSSSIVRGYLKTIEKKNIDRLPDDPIQLESVWIGSHYVNLRFYMDYKSKTHSIALVCAGEDVNEENIHLYFSHNSNDDPAGYKIYAIASFDLEQTMGNPKGNKTLYIHLNTSNYGEKIYELKY